MKREVHEQILDLHRAPPSGCVSHLQPSSPLSDPETDHELNSSWDLASSQDELEDIQVCIKYVYQ